MIPTKVTIHQVFSPQCRYLVPIFQRQYVWSRRDQWEPLWEDIAQKAREVARGGSKPPRRHFMGAIVLRGLPFTGREPPGVEVIDGQQRLTTLQIVLIALRDYCRSRSFAVTANSLGQMTENPTIFNTELEQIKVVPTTRDRAYFHDLWESGTPDELGRRYPEKRRPRARRPDPPPRLVGAYQFFHDAIRNFVEQAWDDEEALPDVSEHQVRAHHLFTALANYLELVRIDLDESDDPQVIFETLNARGVQLSAGDLVRNYVFLEATRASKSQDEVVRLYSTYWRQYDETESAAFWKEEVSQGRLTKPRFELFLFHFLSSQLTRSDDEIQLAHLYRAFGDWWLGGASTQTRDVEETLREMNRYSQLYRRLLARDDADRLAVFGRRLRAMDVSTIYPLLLFLFVERADETANEQSGIITDLESYLVRRIVCGLTTKGYNRIFLKLLTDLRKRPVVNRAAVQELLLELSGPTGIWPDDELFRERWLYIPAYESLRTGRAGMVLEAIEWQQYGAKQEHAPFAGSGYTVEHILPQTPVEADWPLPIDPDADEQARQGAIDTRNRLTHSFGNLTLVTGSLNSFLSNDTFADKLVKLRESVLKINRYWDTHQIDSWSEERIVERGERLFKLALTIWPRPTPPTPGS